MDERVESWGESNTAAVSIPSELRFGSVSHCYGDVCVLRDISLTVHSGSVTCLLGPSGSGKSTLLRIAAGMLRPTSGSIFLDDREISGDSVFLEPEHRGIGLVFQDYALFPHMTLLQNVMFGLSHLSRGERVQLGERMLRRVGLGERASDYPDRLSGGEQQRVALARAIAPRPGVLLMDEPFAGLDSRLRDFVRDETLGVLHETRATALIVTHDPEEALRMGDCVVLLRDGLIEQTGSGHDLFYYPNSLFAARFLSPLNLLDGVCRSGRVETPLGIFDSPDIAENQNCIVAVRTGALCIAQSGSSDVITGRIIDARFSGDFFHLRVGVAGVENPLRVRIVAGYGENGLSASQLEGNDQVNLTIESSGVFVFPA